MSELSGNNGHFFKTTGQGGVYSVFCGDGTSRFLAVVFPEKNGDIEAQTRSALDRLNSLLEREQMSGGVVCHNVFLRSEADRVLVMPLLQAYYKDDLPAITFIPQKPCDDDYLLLFEVWAIRSAPHKLRIRRFPNGGVSVDTNEMSLGFFGDLLPDADAPSGAYDRSLSALNRMQTNVEAAGFKLDHLLRTWIYQGSIVRPEGTTQRYKELNRARTDFFEGHSFLDPFKPENFRGAVYPASTGIGADGMDVTLSALAIATSRSDVRAIPLENPDQTPAFDYGAVYSPQSPKFSRAMALVADGRCMIFVSGTASIVDSETVHIGDAEGQAEQTLENIRRLIDGENLARYGFPGFTAGLKNLALARIYVKRREDYAKIRTRCEAILGATPMIFTFADVCRDDLLVEIEGVVSCGTSAGCAAAQ